MKGWSDEWRVPIKPNNGKKGKQLEKVGMLQKTNSLEANTRKILSAQKMLEGV
jgi:hypothetical protein